MPLWTSFKAFVLRRRRWLIGLGALYGIYALVGFFVLPGVLKRRIVAALKEATHREVSLGRVRVNPLVLSVTLEDLAVRGKSGGPWMSVGKLYANAQIFPLLWKTFELKALVIERPNFKLTLDPEGRPDFSDLLGPDEPKDDAKPTTPSTWTVAVDHFSLAEGHFAFEDQGPKEPFHTTFGPMNLRLDGFRTQLGSRGTYGFEAWTEAGERLKWEGSLGVTPLRSAGRLLLENVDLPKYSPYLAEAMVMQIRGGKVSAEARYSLAFGGGEQKVQIEDATLKVEGFEGGGAGEAQALRLPVVVASAVNADFLKNRIRVGRLEAKDGAISVAMDAQGRLNLSRLFAPPPGVKPKPKDPKAAPLSLVVDTFAVSNFTMGLEDVSRPRPVKVEVYPLGIEVRGFSMDPKGSADLRMEATLKEGGRIEIGGALKPFAFSADLHATLDRIALAPFDAYLAPAADLRLLKGDLSVKGQLRAAFEKRRTDGITFQGEASVADLEAADGRDLEVTSRWKLLRLSGMKLTTAPMALALKEWSWEAPEARLVVAADGTTNVARALKLMPEKQAPTASATPPTPKPGGEEMALALQQVLIHRGRLSFVDRSLTPNAALLLSDLEGRFERLSTAPEANSTLLLTGMAGGVAPLRIEGRAMPLRTEKDTDVRLKIEAADLTDFDPYSRKYVGRILQKGKLFVDASIKIQQRKLDALAQVKLDQCYLGDKVESPDATWIPVKLALALLRDRKGVIALELPVQGSLDDPDVKYGKLVWKVVLNVFSKIATSPFAALGNLFGGGADLSAIAFAPGSAQVDEASKKVIAGLAKSLEERPDLALEFEGAADPALDGGALRRAALESQLKNRAWAQAGRSGEAEAAFSMSSSQREAALRALHASAFPQDPKAPKAPEPPLAEMEARLLGHLPDDPEAMRQLAEARADAVQAALLAAGAPKERIFPVKGTLKADQQKAPKVWFAVR